MSTSRHGAVRPATPADAEAMAALRAAVAAEGRWIGAEPPVDEVAAAAATRAAIAEGKGVFVADADGVLAGTAFTYVSTPGVTTFGMMVAAGHRGYGIGAALLDRVVAWAREQGAHKVTLQVWPHNEPAIALYRRAGFEVEGRLRRHYRRRDGALWDAVLMALHLDEGLAAPRPSC
ncbi:GNAT family N-acetyltransferase [Nocardia asteroides]|uniref:GNAT family N-acetyltransferase n=1 Tax=Nocardia asteroides TaxID=1824 RepID=UPI001E63FBE8|nr:GNAT family N-acetyltransferase [Nocardia asteroides]UGT63113.1 GNAT family N-acetyltransferase [Nocardia asteroides]